MDKLTYAVTLIAELHKRTISGITHWQEGSNTITTQLGGTIEVSIKFYDVGPDSSQWEYISFTSPVNRDFTILGNPREPKAKYCEIQASGATLEQMNLIFAKVILEPRVRAFADIMKKLTEP